MHFSFQSESFLIFVFVFVKKVYAISVHNDNLSFTKTEQCINKEICKNICPTKNT